MLSETTAPFWREPLGALQLWQWAGLVLCVVFGLLLGLAFASVIRRVVHSVVKRTPVPWDDHIADAIHPPMRIWCALISTYVMLGLLKLPTELMDDLSKVTRAGAIATTVWGLIRALYAVADAVADGTFVRETLDTQRLARARSLRTQVIVATRVASALLFVLGLAMIALQFSAVRTFGMSLLASAGVAGVVLGIAAQKSLGALLAGIQLSISQPIRIGDNVIVQNEFGTIEDIGLTYVTVKVWDDRRLIVPTPRFLDEPFQNWSRSNVGLTGTVFLKLDFDVPLTALRETFEQMMDKEPSWDGRVKAMHVTDVGDRSLEIRFLVSARSPGDLWAVRTSVREKMVTWLQERDGGRHLPRTRLAITDAHEPASQVLSERMRTELRSRQA
ncbi:MAG: mechanosensitive ion channel domain-containing protein [Polyangiales bacterium]